MVIISPIHDIEYNLEYEQYLINCMPPESRILFIWQNGPCVVIGKHQDPETECNLEAMKQDGVKLARRQSGGGAVYHDMGNVCFSIITPREEFDKKANFALIICALASLGVQAETSGRNDIVLTGTGQKISGSAFELTAARACHHGTMLLDVDLSVMDRYLTPDSKKLARHGVSSVRARVINTGIKPQDFINAVITAFEEQEG